MDPDLIFKLYEKLVFELKKELESNDLVPDLIERENGEVEPSKEDLEKYQYISDIIRKLINFVGSGTFLG